MRTWTSPWFSPLVVVLAALCLPSCGKPEGLATVKGTLRLPSPAPGKPFVVIIARDPAADRGTRPMRVPRGSAPARRTAPDLEIVASMTGMLGKGVRYAYQIDKVPAGRYFVFAFVDMSGDGDDEEERDVGDLFGIAGDGEEFDGTPPTVVPESGVVTAHIDLQTEGEDGWPEVGGTITFPASAAGKPFYIFIDDNPDPDDGYIDVDGDIVERGTSVRYQISNVPPGDDLFVYAWVDVDEDDEISPRDLMGYFHGRGSLPPPRGDLDLPRPPKRGDSHEGTAVEADVTVAPVGATLTGKFSLPEGKVFDIAGKTYYLYLDDDPNPLNGVKMRFARRLGDEVPTTVRYEESNAPAGEGLILYGLVDLDDSGSITTGDLFGYLRSDNVKAGEFATSASKVDVPASGMVKADLEELLLVKNVVTGTVTVPSPQEGKEYTVEVRRDTGEATRVGIFSQGKLGSETRAPYFLVNRLSGKVFVNAYVSVTGRISGPNIGDLFGSAGGSDGSPPAEGVEVEASGTTTIDVTVSPIRNFIRGQLNKDNIETKYAPMHLVLTTDRESPTEGVVRAFIDLSRDPSLPLYFSWVNLPANDSYYINVWQDVDKSGAIDAGDYRGYFNAQPGDPPTPPDQGFSFRENEAKRDVEVVLFKVP